MSCEWKAWIRAFFGDPRSVEPPSKPFGEFLRHIEHCAECAEFLNTAEESGTHYEALTRLWPEIEGATQAAAHAMDTAERADPEQAEIETDVQVLLETLDGHLGATAREWEPVLLYGVIERLSQVLRRSMRRAESSGPGSCILKRDGLQVDGRCVVDREELVLQVCRVWYRDATVVDDNALSPAHMKVPREVLDWVVESAGSQSQLLRHFSSQSVGDGVELTIVPAGDRQDDARKRWGAGVVADCASAVRADQIPDDPPRPHPRASSAGLDWRQYASTAANVLLYLALGYGIHSAQFYVLLLPRSLQRQQNFHAASCSNLLVGAELSAKMMAQASRPFLVS